MTNAAGIHDIADYSSRPRIQVRLSVSIRRCGGSRARCVMRDPDARRILQWAPYRGAVVDWRDATQLTVGNCIVDPWMRHIALLQQQYVAHPPSPVPFWRVYSSVKKERLHKREISLFSSPIHVPHP